VTTAVRPPGWRAWIEPWFLSYGFVGASVAGMVPILLPLSIGKSGSVADIGLVVGAFNLGGLSAPLWGGIADRHGYHRLLLTCGLLVSTLTIGLFPFASSITARLILALGQGAGAASAATVANLFIVEVHPRPEWDERIGWLQTFYGAGQVIGLFFAGILASANLQSGFLLASAITLLACLPAMFMKGPIGRTRVIRPALKHPSRHSEFSAGSPQTFYHHCNPQALKRILQSSMSPLGVFLLAWLVSFGGAAAFFSLYPVVMKTAYGVDPSISSICFAVAAAGGLFLYAPAGTWSRKHGPIKVLQVALGGRIVAFGALVALTALSLGSARAPALISFVVVVLAWSLLSVAGTEITAQFSEANEGEGLGMFNACTSVAGVLGAVIGGWGAEMWGYACIPAMGIGGALVGMVLIGVISRKTRDQKGKETR